MDQVGNVGIVTCVGIAGTDGMVDGNPRTVGGRRHRVLVGVESDFGDFGRDSFFIVWNFSEMI